LATKYTSFVAVADNDSPTNDTLQIQQISMSKPPQLEASKYGYARKGNFGTSWGSVGDTLASPFGVPLLPQSTFGSSFGNQSGQQPFSSSPGSFSFSSTPVTLGSVPPTSALPKQTSGPRSVSRSSALSDQTPAQISLFMDNPLGSVTSSASKQTPLGTIIGVPLEQSTFGSDYSSSPTSFNFSTPPVTTTASPFSALSKQQTSVPASTSPFNPNSVNPFSTVPNQTSLFSNQKPITTSINLFMPQQNSVPASTSLFNQTPSQFNSFDPFSSSQPSQSNENIKTQIVSSQQFDGCWDEPAIRAILGSNTQAALNAKPNCNQKLWLTALAIAILEIKCHALKSNWDIVANKAKTFMSKYLLTQEKMEKEKITPYVNQLIDKAQELLRTLNI